MFDKMECYTVNRIEIPDRYIIHDKFMQKFRKILNNYLQQQTREYPIVRINNSRKTKDPNRIMIFEMDL